MPTSPNPLLWSFYRQIGAGEETGGMVHHEDAHSSDLYLNSGVREQNANVQFGDWENASWGQVQEFYPEHYSNFELDQPYAGNVYATGVKLNDPVNELYLHHYRYDRENTQLEEISKSQVSYKPVVPRPPKDERLRFVAEEAGSTITLQVVGSLSTIPVLEYSTDGNTWMEFRCDNAPVITLANVGDKVYIRGNNNYFAEGFSSGIHIQPKTNDYTNFVMTGSVSAYGSIDYLRSKDGIVSNTPRKHCYRRLFYNCASLKKAPEFPHNYVGENAYCETLARTRITQAPNLLASYVEENAYYGMLSGCTSLLTFPLLQTQFTTLTIPSGRYAYMCDGCTSLTEVKLPFTSTGIGQSAMDYIFNDCTSLHKITVQWKYWPTSDSLRYWTNNVSSIGTFVCPEELPVEHGIYRIPTNWQVSHESS